jgi:hypothetical protein
MYQHRFNHSLRRFGVATSLGALLGAGGLFSLLDGTAHAEGDVEPRDPFESEVVVVNTPLITLPDGPDDPVFDGPIVTVPIVPGDDGPTFDGPIVTIPIGPGDATPPEDTTPPEDPTPPEDTTPPTEPPVDPPVDQPQGNATPPADEAPTGPTNIAPFVRITSATVDCAGMVHVSYDTGATPGLAPENEHVVMVSPASNPASVTSHRLFHRPVNATFTVDLQSPAAEAYRVFVVADFEPANVDGVVLVDEADAAAPVDCPAG